MLLLFICFAFLCAVELLIKLTKPETAKDEKKMRFIRISITTMMSPAIAIGMIQLRGDQISESFWFVILLFAVLSMLTAKTYYEYKND